MAQILQCQGWQPEGIDEPPKLPGYIVGVTRPTIGPRKYEAVILVSVAQPLPVLGLVVSMPGKPVCKRRVQPNRSGAAMRFYGAKDDPAAPDPLERLANVNLPCRQVDVRPPEAGRFAATDTGPSIWSGRRDSNP